MVIVVALVGKTVVAVAVVAVVDNKAPGISVVDSAVVVIAVVVVTIWPGVPLLIDILPDRDDVEVEAENEQEDDDEDEDDDDDDNDNDDKGGMWLLSVDR